MTLTEFLLARIAEDEAEAKATQEYGGGWDGWPTRVLAECEAKRRIVGSFSEFVGPLRAARLHETRILRALALLYADHSDYDETWKL